MSALRAFCFGPYAVKINETSDHQTCRGMVKIDVSLVVSGCSVAIFHLHKRISIKRIRRIEQLQNFETLINVDKWLQLKSSNN
jgi:hypothetical protein